jgi:hypothetical protein
VGRARSERRAGEEDRSEEGMERVEPVEQVERVRRSNKWDQWSERGDCMVWLGSMCSYCRLCIDVQLLKAARCRVAATNDALRRTDSM